MPSVLLARLNGFACVMRCPSLSNPAARAVASTLVTGWARSASVTRKKNNNIPLPRRRFIQDIIWPESHRCERSVSAATSDGGHDHIPSSPSVRPHACGVILLLSLASPRTGGPHACHYRTAGSDSCARRRGSRRAARGGRTETRRPPTPPTQLSNATLEMP